MICISLFGFMILNNYLILLFGIVLILALVSLFFYINKSSYEGLENNVQIDATKMSNENPLYNVMPVDYQNNVNKEKMKTNYNISREESINNSAKNFILEQNKDNSEIGNIFKSVTDNMEFDKSMRQFYTNPSTTIPNTQDDFLNYCYGDLPSEKPLIIH